MPSIIEEKYNRAQQAVAHFQSVIVNFKGYPFSGLVGVLNEFVQVKHFSRKPEDSFLNSSKIHF